MSRLFTALVLIVGGRNRFILAEGAIALSVTLSGGALFANGKLSQFPLSLIVKVIPALFMQASAQHYFSMCPTVLVIIWGRRWKFQAGERPAERKSFHALLLSIIFISTFAESSPSWPSLVAIMNKGFGASLVLVSSISISARAETYGRSLSSAWAGVVQAFRWRIIARWGLAPAVL